MRINPWRRLSRQKKPQLWRVKHIEPLTPRQRLGDLFTDVQQSGIFIDSKTFVDAIPKESSNVIAQKYQSIRKSQVDLEVFIKQHFVMPKVVEPNETTTNHLYRLPIDEYIEKMWAVLELTPVDISDDSSLLPIPHSHIVPGGRFREMYYWDSYFSMLGLRESGHHEMIESMVKNFAFLIDSYGYIANGNRSYYLSRSQPPVFALMVELLAEIDGEAVYGEYLPHLLTEYQYWMLGKKSLDCSDSEVRSSQRVVRMPGGEFLNRYWDTSVEPREESFVEDVAAAKTHKNPTELYRNIRAAAESGWDFSSRWMEDPADFTSMRTTDIVPVDLNVLLLRMEKIIACAYQTQGEESKAHEFMLSADRRREALNKYLWSEDMGWYTDYVLSESNQIPEPTIAGVFALYGGVASSGQAELMVQTIRNKFLKKGGLVTSLQSTTEQWDAPNGWAPLQYIAIKGLERYGHCELAQEIAQRWCQLVQSRYEETGRIYEKYNVEHLKQLPRDGEYTVQTGYGWTNGVYLALVNSYNSTQ